MHISDKKPGAYAARMIAVVGMLSALSAAFAFLESLLPGLPFMPPGAKLGLSNIVTMITGWLLGTPYAVLIAIIKAAFALFTRGATAGLMSLAGGLISAIVTSLMLRSKKPAFGYVGIGIAGGICHNIGQLAAAVAVTSTAVIGYLPFLLIAGAIAGCVTGIALYYVVRSLVRLKIRDKLLYGGI